MFKTTQTDPEVVFWPSGFLEAWGTKAEKLQEHCGFRPCRRRRQGPKNIIVLKMCGLLALVSQVSKKPLGQQKHFGIPLNNAVPRPGVLKMIFNFVLGPGGPGGGSGLPFS